VDPDPGSRVSKNAYPMRIQIQIRNAAGKCGKLNAIQVQNFVENRIKCPTVPVEVCKYTDDTGIKNFPSQAEFCRLNHALTEAKAVTVLD